jgi:hypothetical protein
VGTVLQSLSATLSRGVQTVWQYRAPSSHPAGPSELAAGQSRRLAILWGGGPNRPGARLVPGLYQAHAGLDGLNATADIRVVR